MPGVQKLSIGGSLTEQLTSFQILSGQQQSGRRAGIQQDSGIRALQHGHTQEMKRATKPAFSYTSVHGTRCPIRKCLRNARNDEDVVFWPCSHGEQVTGLISPNMIIDSRSILTIHDGAACIQPARDDKHLEADRVATSCPFAMHASQSWTNVFWSTAEPRMELMAGTQILLQRH